MDMMPEPPIPSMDDPNAAPPMDDPNGMPPMDDEDPNAMPPMDDPNAAPPTDEQPDNGGDTQEIDDIFNQLSIEDKNALVKYGKSMMGKHSDDDQGDDANQPMGDMPEPPMQESKKNLDALIDEALDDILGTSNVKKRVENKRNDEYDNNPFVSPII